jgi:hypothetical protein
MVLRCLNTSLWLIMASGFAGFWITNDATTQRIGRIPGYTQFVQRGSVDPR